MELDLITISLGINMVLSFTNIIAYAIGIYRVGKAKIDGQYKRFQRILVFNFVNVVIVAAINTGVYYTVLFDPIHTTLALYFLNLAILLFNVGFLAYAMLLASIVEDKKRPTVHKTEL